MTAEVHDFEGREGGAFRISLTYDAPNGAGKTTSQTDTYHGHFAQLVPDELVVEVLEFETTDPTLSGQMKVTTMLSDGETGPRSSSCTTGFLTVCRSATTRPGPGCLWQISPRW